MENNDEFGRALAPAIDLLAVSKIRGQRDPSAPGFTSPDNFYYGASDFQLPEGSTPVFLDPFQFVSLLGAFKPWRRPVRVKPFTVGLTPVEILPLDDTRTYFCIINTSQNNRIYVGFDSAPTGTEGVPIEINLGAYEPQIVPTNAIYVTGQAAATTGVLLYAN